MDAEKVDLNEAKLQVNGFESEVHEDEEEEEEEKHASTFSDMAFQVMVHIEKARENEEYKTLPKADWDRHWRNIFDEIRRGVLINERFPVPITTPPVYEVYLRCTNERDELCCPCGFDHESLPFVKIEVPREQPNGVTKDLLVAKISEALHGIEDAPGQIGAVNDKTVLDVMDWRDGDGIRLYDTIFLYCLGMTSHEIRT